jgi:hypothetical protein
MSNSKQDQLIDKIFEGLMEISERTTAPNLAQILLQTLLATNSLRQELERQAISTPVAVEFDVDQAVVDAAAAEFQPVAKPDLTLMTLGQIKKLYPDVRGVVSDTGFVDFEDLLDKYDPDCLFKDYVKDAHGGDYFGNWNHYVDRDNLISI